MFGHAVAMDMSCDRTGVILEAIREKKAPVFQKVVEPACARLDQLQHGKKPGVTLGQQRSVPETGGLKQWLEAERQLVGSEATDVLLVEPVELFSVEDGITTA